ncbi:hypothetical protein Q8F55_005843 [Vanrija albida]|uniref:Uncharacterized protein n=1 Tax=Vanrija albida TaxID=181172 RepID=A0ABR3Q2Q6_9TREE
MRLALLFISALTLVSAQDEGEDTWSPSSTSSRRGQTSSGTITRAPTGTDTYKIILPSTTSAPPVQHDPAPGYSVNNTEVTYPTSQDYWVVNGTGVVKWKWGGGDADMISVWLMNDGTMYNGLVTPIGRMANTQGSARNLTRIVGLYATELHPGKGYYVKLTKTVSGPVGANGENLDTIYAESNTFEVKPAGSKLTFPKGFGSGAERSATLGAGVVAAAAAAAAAAAVLL